MDEGQLSSRTPPAPNRWQLARLAVSGVAIAAIILSGWRLAAISFRTAGVAGDASAQGLDIRPQAAFDLQRLVVDRSEILSGGPPKDGIPALTNLRFVTALNAKFLRPGDRVIGIRIGDVARAYPLSILNYHEIVNDKVDAAPIAVTYCPLCDSAVVFDRRTPLGEREFGVSGLLYNSNVLMYDRAGRPESLWSQAKTSGISGPAADRSLTTLPLELTTGQPGSRKPRCSRPILVIAATTVAIRTRTILRARI